MNNAFARMLALWQPRPPDTEPIASPFLPNEVQEEYYVTESPIKLWVAANRTGKTLSGLQDDIWRAHGVHPYLDVPLIDRMWIGVPSYGFWEETLRPYWERLLPPHLLIYWNHTRYAGRVRRVDGGSCAVKVMTYDQDPTTWAGAAVGHIHLDELPKHEHYKEAVARVSSVSGTISITVTPVDGLGWVEDDLFVPGLSGERTDVVVLSGALAEYDPTCVCGHEEGRHQRSGCQHEGCGCRSFRYRSEGGVGRVLVRHYTREQVVQFARGYKDHAERMIRVFGIYSKRSGRTYRSFDRAVHVVPAFSVPSTWEVWAGCDPGFHGFTIIFFAMSPTGHLFVFHEFFSQQETHSTQLRRVWKDVLALLPWLRDDPEASIPIYTDTANPQDILELNERAAEAHVPMLFTALKQGLKARGAGIKRVQAYLDPSPLRSPPLCVLRPTPAAGEPLLYLMDSLYSEWTVRGATAGEEGKRMEGSRLVWEFERYDWKPPTKNEPHPRDADENSAGGAHAMAALRYALMARLSPPDVEPEDRSPDPRDAQFRRAEREARERARAQAGW